MEYIYVKLGITLIAAILIWAHILKLQAKKEKEAVFRADMLMQAARARAENKRVSVLVSEVEVIFYDPIRDGIVILGEGYIEGLGGKYASELTENELLQLNCIRLGRL